MLAGQDRYCKASNLDGFDLWCKFILGKQRQNGMRRTYSK